MVDKAIKEKEMMRKKKVMNVDVNTGYVCVCVFVDAWWRPKQDTCYKTRSSMTDSA